MTNQRWWHRLDEAPSWRGKSIEERAKAIEAACKAAIQLLEAAPDKQARLDRVDLVPPSTHALLRRLAAGRNA